MNPDTLIAYPASDEITVMHASVRHPGLRKCGTQRSAVVDLERAPVLSAGDDPVVITGEPAELTMFLFGRHQHTGLKFEGPQDRVEALQAGDLGI